LTIEEDVNIITVTLANLEILYGIIGTVKDLGGFIMHYCNS